MSRFSNIALVIFWLFFGSSAAYADLADVIEKVKPSIVAVGTYKKTQSPPFVFRGTGFVIGDGNQVATNAHVLPATGTLDEPVLAVLIRGKGSEGSLRLAKVIHRNTERDLAVIRIEGPPLVPLKVGDSSAVREGQAIAFTGFPIGGALGYSPVTHRGIVSAITPIGIPGGNASQLNPQLIQQLKRGVFDVFQLDATAYPGNSGSPVYETDSGTVIGIVNMVFVKGSKEAAISSPSGITYAIPSNYLK
ncbi:MAG: serine protease [Azonexus sp.]|nr:serine protease [Azonexus sp.]